MGVWLGSGECRALFDHWRTLIMGNLGAATALPSVVGGYFYRVERDAPLSPPGPPIAVPLGEVRRTLLAILDRVELSDDQRNTIELYYGLHGLPLAFASASGLDIAAGRDESSVRATCRAALARVAPHVWARPMTSIPAPTIRNPVQEVWFRSRLPTPEARREVLARAYVRAVAQCDGPYGAPTLAALERWYLQCGYADLDLLNPDLVNGRERSDRSRPDRAGREPRRRARPNRNALARAGALMEIAAYEELLSLPAHCGAAASRPPTPSAPTPELHRLSETVTHPDLVALVADEITPQALMAAAHVLRTQALDGVDVSGQLTLLLRCLRPRLGLLSARELERIAVSITYVASADANPFVALEWLGHFLNRVGVTDRTFTVLVNTSVAASRAGHLKLAHRTDQLFCRLQRTWIIPPTEIPVVEHTEAEQQRLVAASLRLEHLGRRRHHVGAASGASDAFRASTELATRSIRIAHTVLTDTRRFPVRPIPTRVSDHGGDLTWHWYLGAVLRLVESLSAWRQSLAAAPGGGPATTEDRRLLRRGGLLAAACLDEYAGTLDSPRFEGWYGFIHAECERLVDA